MAFAVVTLIALTISIAAQTETPAPKDPQKARPRTTASSAEQKDQAKDPKTITLATAQTVDANMATDLVFLGP